MRKYSAAHDAKCGKRIESGVYTIHASHAEPVFAIASRRSSQQPPSEACARVPRGGRRRRRTVLTAITVHEVADKVLHDAILLGHAPLEANKLEKDVLVIPFQGANASAHILALFP